MIALVGVVQATLGLASAQEPVDPHRVSAVLQAADRVVVVEDEHSSRRVLLDSTDRVGIESLREALVVAAEDGVCACLPTLHIRVYRGVEETASFGYLGDRLHSSLWSGDAKLANAEALLTWFDAHGIRGPRKEAQERDARVRQSVESERRWVEAMPPPLKPLWASGRDRILAEPVNPDIAAWRLALEREYPDRQQRITALLPWFGSGEGPWSGYPSYESFAEELLLDFEAAELIAAIESNISDERALEGGARLFAGWELSQRTPETLSQIPPQLKQVLLEHSLRSTDEDKRSRARTAFGVQ
jgi:hypothetical protein